MIKKITAGAMNLRLAAIRLLNSSIAATRSQSADSIVSLGRLFSFNSLAAGIISLCVTKVCISNACDEKVGKAFTQNSATDYRPMRARAPKPGRAPNFSFSIFRLTFAIGEDRLRQWQRS